MLTTLYQIFSRLDARSILYPAELLFRQVPAPLITLSILVSDIVWVGGIVLPGNIILLASLFYDIT